MVKPSAHASHILVASKSEAVQISEKIGKLKDFQKFARKRNPPALLLNEAVTLVGSAKATWSVNLRRLFGVHPSKRYPHRSKLNSDIISFGFMSAMRSDRFAHLRRT